MSTVVFLSPNQISKIPDTQKYLDLITSQHKTQPKFMSWLSSTLNIVDDAVTVTNDIPSSFDVDVASGVQLDVLGEILGRNRTLNFQPGDGSSPVLNDDNYRKILKAKIALNQWDGTIPGIYDIWNNLFPDVGMQIVDNQDMTMSALIEGVLEEIYLELVANGYVIPKPFGVGLTILGLSTTTEKTYFGALVTEADAITISTNVPS